MIKAVKELPDEEQTKRLVNFSLKSRVNEREYD